MGAARERHAWIRCLDVAYVPGPATPLLTEFAGRLLEEFRRQGHTVQAVPDASTDLVLTSARLGEPLDWREALLFTARRKFGLTSSPTIVTMVHATRCEWAGMLGRLQAALAKSPPHPADFSFAGLAPQAWRTLVEQGQRGGPILALMRVVQAQAKCIRVLLLVGDDTPDAAYHFDLVGSYPRSEASEGAAFYEDIVLRIATTLSTVEVARHRVVADPIPAHVWAGLAAPAAMIEAGRQLGERGFFTDMVVIARLVHVPAVSDAVSSQYSEGCFATWEPALNALMATVTGSARPVDKGSLTEDDLAVVVGVRPDGLGAEVRHVEGKRNDPPSSEAVEMMWMDSLLPSVTLGPEWGLPGRVPVVRSKLHGHRGVAAYDPRQVEFVALDPPYYYYPVSCATDAQARGIRAAFARSEALRNPADPRQVVFTVLPGHGAVIAEKWVLGKRPFQAIWELMDVGGLQIARIIPQGPFRYLPGADGLMHVCEG
jgi:hypothetical protein